MPSEGCALPLTRWLRGAQPPTPSASRAADSASFHQDCEVKRRSCVLLPQCNDTQIQKNLVCGHVNSKFRLQESDDEIPPTCKSRRNPRMLALRTPSRSLLDCPLNWCIRIGSWRALTWRSVKEPHLPKSNLTNIHLHSKIHQRQLKHPSVAESHNQSNVG